MKKNQAIFLVALIAAIIIVFFYSFNGVEDISYENISYENVSISEGVSCEDMGGRICSEDESCSGGEVVYVAEGICCMEECEKNEDNLWIISIIVVGVLFGIVLKFKKKIRKYFKR